MVPSEWDEPVDTACPCDTLWDWLDPLVTPRLPPIFEPPVNPIPTPAGSASAFPPRESPPLRPRLVLWLVPVELDTPTELVTDCDWVSVVLDPTVFELLVPVVLELLVPVVSELLVPVVSELLFPVVSVLLFPTESLQVLPSV